MRVLFVCNQNENRSRTAEALFKDTFTTRSAGLHNQQPVTEEQITWADIVVVMEDRQRNELAKRFPKQYLQKKIVSLDVPDIYSYNQPELIHTLKEKVAELL